MYLASAGVGTLGVVDPDNVELSNLHRQVAYTTADIGKYKVDCVAQAIYERNPDVTVQTYRHRFDESTSDSLCANYNIVIDASDNFPTRYLVNRSALRYGMAAVFASVFRFEAQITTCIGRNAAVRWGLTPGPCFACLFAQAPPANVSVGCAGNGILGVLPAVAGSLQATEAVKLILRAGNPLIGRLLVYDALSMQFHTLGYGPKSDCKKCGSEGAGMKHDDRTSP